jgi:pyridoxal phosphate enzyme (YggS family)
MIADNLRDVTLRISRCCEKAGREPSSVKLVCVTKEAGMPQIEEVLRLGVMDIGENRVQDAVSKYGAIAGRANLHLIGHLQTNKVKDAVKISALIHSVDSLRLADKISQEAGKIGKTQDILVQVNTSGEESKFGVAPDGAINLFRKAVLYPNINILGLMTIAPEAGDPDTVRPFFRRLRELRDELQGLKLTARSLQLSMGMTGDLETAIEEGATIVRIGRAIFG